MSSDFPICGIVACKLGLPPISFLPECIAVALFLGAGSEGEKTRSLDLLLPPYFASSKIKLSLQKLSSHRAYYVVYVCM